MARRTDEEIFLDSVPKDGTSIGNKGLCDWLDWDYSRYERVRGRLLEKDLIYLGKGNGGSVRLVMGDKRALLRCVPIDGSVISDSSVRQQLGWGEDIYKKVRRWLIDGGVLINKEAGVARAPRRSTPAKETDEEEALLALLPRGNSSFSVQDVSERLKWSEERVWEVRARLVQKERLTAPVRPTAPRPPRTVKRNPGISSEPVGPVPKQGAATKSGPIEVFFSYSHHDRPEMLNLEKHLSALKRLGLVAIWHDGQIAPGTNWFKSIHENLERAHVVILLISSSFIASDYCYSKEMERAIERHKADDTTVIPVILKPCDWHGTSFSNLQALPAGGKAVTSWLHPDEAYTEVAKGIRAVVEQLARKPEHA